MSLDHLARQIIELARSGNSTAVIVTPDQFSLRPQFYAELASQLVAIDSGLSGIEIDCYQSAEGRSGFFGDLRSRRLAKRIGRAVGQLKSVPIRVRWTALLSRPSKSGRIVIGCCDQRQPLPSWAAPIRLSITPGDEQKRNGFS